MQSKACHNCTFTATILWFFWGEGLVNSSTALGSKSTSFQTKHNHQSFQEKSLAPELFPFVCKDTFVHNNILKKGPQALWACRTPPPSAHPVPLCTQGVVVVGGGGDHTHCLSFTPAAWHGGRGRRDTDEGWKPTQGCYPDPPRNTGANECSQKSVCGSAAAAPQQSTRVALKKKIRVEKKGMNGSQVQ